MNDKPMLCIFTYLFCGASLTAIFSIVCITGARERSTVAMGTSLVQLARFGAGTGQSPGSKSPDVPSSPSRVRSK